MERRAEWDEIRALYATGDWTYKRLAERYGVSTARIGQVLTESPERERVKRITPFQPRRLTRCPHPDLEDDCLLWEGRLRDGYGVWSGRSVHRLAYERQVGPIAKGLTIHHRCRRRNCVQVSHLEALTPSAHSTLHGPPQPQPHRFDHAKAASLYAQGDRSLKSIASELGVTVRAISMAVNAAGVPTRPRGHRYPKRVSV